jgi:hypothetical protein
MPTSKMKDHPFHLSKAAYSVYSQLPSIAGGHPSIRNPMTRNMLWLQETSNMDINVLYSLNA